MDWLKQRAWCALLSIALTGGLGCDPTSRKLSGTDCRPRKLTKMQTCAGEDHGFQECGFFFRATGVPDRRWCEGFTAQEVAGEPRLRRCDWNSPAAWTRVSCATYNTHGAASCFACDDSAPEARKTYVYAYDATCTRGIEQVTCNVAAEGAGAGLGPIAF